MKEVLLDIASNEPLAPGVFRIDLTGDVSAVTVPGQFVDIKIDGLFLRRPLSVYDCGPGRLSLIYKAVGQGTCELSRMKTGRLSVLTGLGNGFDLSKCGNKPLLIGGGVGIPPLYWLAKKLLDVNGVCVTAVLGFNTASEVFAADQFRALGVNTILCTADGSAGVRGFVTDALPEDGSYTFFYSCGPEPMLRAVCKKTSSDGQLSFEERMGCGFGVCMGCSRKTVGGYKRICRDGPVLGKGEVLWDD
jgi:dihydroorotate dehydrogenase electron transfer subunit